MTGFRLPSGGTAIDRSRPLTAIVNGRPLTGFAGDTLATALIAAGRPIMARSFKYHRPRGILASGRDEPNALFDIGSGTETIPNCQATMVPLSAGLIASSVNVWPSPERDAKGLLSRFHRFLPAGFYYKTFMKPSWMVFEPFIRKMAGLGKLPLGSAATDTKLRYLHCDILVIGGGTLGIAAASQAKYASASVILLEDGLLPDMADIPEGILALDQTLAFAIHENGYVLAVQGNARQLRIRAQKIILASGHAEQPLLFPGNDRPGVMLASAMRELLCDFGVLPGKMPLLIGNNGYCDELADDLREAGYPPIAMLDTNNGDVINHVHYRGGKITAATVTSSGLRHLIECDCIAMSGGWSPRLQLLMQAGGKLAPDAVTGRLAATQIPPNMELSFSEYQEGERPTFAARTGAPQFVDFQNDVTTSDIALAAREGFVSVEHLKRYTTLGMATDQGRTSNINGLNVMADVTGRSPAQVGTTRYRPPYAPVPFAVMAAGQTGRLLAPLRFLPAHAEQAAAEALFEDHGGWYRPTCFPDKGEAPRDAVQREARMVREACGMMDASPLGKIEVTGPDAAAFLDLAYLQTMSKMKPGRIKYGLMLSETGNIIDDGVATRLTSDHYLVGTTSGNVANIAANFEAWLQGDFPHLDVCIADVTTSWGVLTLTGPAALRILTALGTDIDLRTFAHLDYREGTVGGYQARVSRVSYTGEVSYEIAVASDALSDLWNRASSAGAKPFGLDALMVLRTEKGYLHIGSDTDSATLPVDVGFGAIQNNKKTDFIGKRSLFLPDALRNDRLQIVGLTEVNGGVLPVGGHILAQMPGANRLSSDGFITSSMMSPNLGRGVALAMVARGRERMNETVTVSDLGQRYKAIISPLCAYDADGDAFNV